MTTSVPADTLFRTLVDVNTCTAVGCGSVTCLAYALEGTFAIHAATTLANAFIGTLIDVRTITTGGD